MARKTYSKEELAQVLADHQRWLDTRCDMTVYGSRADLRDADLRDADLTGADLRGADLRDADLRDADLTGADLRGADLTGADLRGADLTGADLTRAGLRSADLRDADLRSADLTGADLRGADLTRADLRDADLRDADLTGADLRGADLRGAVLRDGYTKWEQYKTEVVPALCVAGGRTLDEVANPETWGCHSWSNCPMKVAFGADGIREIPALYRQLGNEFIQFFDQGLLPLGEINPTYADAPAAPDCKVEHV